MAMIVRRVPNRLEKMIGGRTGIHSNDALAAAAQNLETLEASCMAEIDTRLHQLETLARRYRDERPSDDQLEIALTHSEAALTASGGIANPLPGRVFALLSAMIDALRNSDRWPRGALEPPVNFAHLVRTGAVTAEAGEHLLEELARCLSAYQAAQIAR